MGWFHRRKGRCHQDHTGMEYHESVERQHIVLAHPERALGSAGVRRQR